VQLINPSALLLLGIIPILILIHSLRPKPKQVEVTNLFLWRQAIKEKRGGLRIKKLTNNLPLLFQILAVILASIALANPVWTYTSHVKGDTIVVLDTSASMKTRTASGVRFDQARKEALRLIDELPGESRMLIIEASSNPILRSPFSDDKKRLKQVIEDIQPSDVPGQIEKAFYLALSFVDPERDDLTYIITDGAGGDLEKLPRTHQMVRTVLVSGGEKNIGITKFEFRQELDLEDQYEILLEVKNFNPHPVLCPIRLTLDEKIVIKKTIGLKALEKKLLIFPHSGLTTGVAQATLELNDDFPIDNNAYAVLNASNDIWVLLVTKGNYFLEKLLQAYPNFMVNSVEEIVPSSWGEQSQRHDIVILDRISPPSTERGNFLLIDAFSPSIPISRIDEIDDVEILDWDRKNPLMSNLDLSGLNIEKATIVKADETLQPILESRESGLMYFYEKKGLRAVFLGFDLTMSDLPLRVAFPVMMSNVVQWLHPHKIRFSSLKSKAGKPFAIYLDAQTRDLSIGTPKGKWDRYLAKSNPFTYQDTSEVGIYTVIEENEKLRHFAINLVDESESDIRVPTAKSDAQKKANPVLQSEPVTAQLPIWILFLLSASTALIFEWYIWLRNR
jgi:Ca-activated chloride channel family protein